MAKMIYETFFPLDFTKTLRAMISGVFDQIITHFEKEKLVVWSLHPALPKPCNSALLLFWPAMKKR